MSEVLSRLAIHDDLTMSIRGNVDQLNVRLSRSWLPAANKDKSSDGKEEAMKGVHIRAFLWTSQYMEAMPEMK
jgi:hypothetical protein